MDLVEVGNMLRSYREDVAKLSARKAAAEMGITHTVLRIWEQGLKAPTLLYRKEIERWSEGHIKAKYWPMSRREAREREVMSDRKIKAAEKAAASAPRTPDEILRGVGRRSHQ